MACGTGGQISPEPAAQNGYVLPAALFFLFGTLLWGALFLQTLSDRYAMEHAAVCREQSRLLAYSGWNLALQQLETEGSLREIVLDRPMGAARAALWEQSPGRVAVEVAAEAGGCRSNVRGTVRLLALPWEEACRWAVTEQPSQLREPGLLLAPGTDCALRESCAQPLAVVSATGRPVTVRIDAPITLDALYVHGDLVLEAPVQARVLYVSGAVSGAAWLADTEALQTYAGAGGYRADVLERAL